MKYALWLVLCGVVGTSILLAQAQVATTAGPATGSAPATAKSKPAPPPKSPEQLFIDTPLHFESLCFGGEKFPACDFAKPDEVRKLIGPYKIKAAYFDGEGRAVESAKADGRYAAVVEIEHGGKVSKRFVTLCRMGEQAGATPAPSTQPDVLLRAGVDADVLKARSADMQMRRVYPYSLYRPWEKPDAIFAAGLFDLTAMKRAGKLLPADTLFELDRQWWVTFKRHYYGFDKIYTKEFVCPRPVEGKPAMTIRDGTLAEAGLKPETAETIDRLCEAWAADAKQGMALCVVRHGVVAIHKAYGVRTRRGVAGEPFKTDTVAELMSTTKFLSGIMVAEFADQGLIGIDDPVDKYVPLLKGLGSPKMPTIRDLYRHTAGFDDSWGDQTNDLEELVADLLPSLPVGRHKYQGTGHALGGKIMEMMTGESVPRMFQKHLFGPLGCKSMKSAETSYGAVGTPRDLAIIGQMMLNGGEYGNMHFTSPKIIAQMQPIPGADRFEPDKTIRWGVGIKMFDSDGFSEPAFGASGSCGSFLKIDPTYDLVITMTRDNEGDKYLKYRGDLVRAVIECIK